jgi:hypothetical protein
MLKPNRGTIPQELKEFDQWVVWRLEKSPDGKPTKIPYNAKTGGKAGSTLPETWSAFDVAWKAYEAGDYSGIGFVVSKDDPFCGIDIDHCVDNFKMTTEALEVIKNINSYTELSPSGTGVRIFCKARLPQEGRKKGAYEVYDSGRFLTVTGQRDSESPAEVMDRQAEVDAFHTKYIAKPPKEFLKPAVSCSNLDDADLIQRATNARNGAEFGRLYSGDHSKYVSQSEADLALMNMLAFWTGRDAARMEGLFRSSGLYRDKCEKGNPTYLARTINEAIKNCGEVYKPKTEITRQVGKRPINLDSILARPDPDKAQEPTQWIIRGMAARGDTILFVGSQKGGKTFLAGRMACELSMGGCLLDGFAIVDPLKVLYLMFDNVGEARFFGRIKKAGWVYNPDNIRFVFNENVRRAGLNMDLDKKNSIFENIIDTWLPDAVFIDTLGSAHDKNESKNEEMKSIMDVLTTMARTRNMAVFILHHTRKRRTQDYCVDMAMDDSVGAGILLRLTSSIIGIKKAIGEDKQEIFVVKNLGSWHKEFQPFEFRLIDETDDRGRVWVKMPINLGCEVDKTSYEAIARVINANFWSGESFTRQDIIKRTGLSSVTVSAVLNRMVEEGILTTVGSTKNKAFMKILK